MPLSPTDHAILATASDCDERCGWPPDAILVDDSVDWLMCCAAEGRERPSRAEVASQIERLAVELYWLGSEEPSRAIRLTPKGREAVEAYSKRFGSEEEEQRAIEFVRAYVSELASGLSFPSILPAYLPGRFGLLPEVKIDEASTRIYLKYYGGEDHFTVSQGSEESWSGGPGGSRQMHDVLVAVTEQQETSLWVSMTLRWTLSTVYYRVSFNWLHQLSSSQPERQPIAMDDGKRNEAWAVVESVIAESQELTL